MDLLGHGPNLEERQKGYASDMVSITTMDLVCLLVSSSASHFKRKHFPFVAKLNCLKTMHSIYRDIKPSNVAFNRDVLIPACLINSGYSSPNYGPDHHVLMEKNIANKVRNSFVYQVS